MNGIVRAFGLLGGVAAALASGLPQLQAQQAAPVGAQARFAFVIGADGYDGAELPTAANDAALVADAFKTAGFEVAGARNLDQETFRAAYREFVEKVAAAGPDAVASVYVSGYGVQSDGENYFVPPGAPVQRESDLALNAIRLSDLTRALAGLPARGRVFAFDVAYAPPFARDWPGLAPGLALVEPDAGALIAIDTTREVNALREAKNLGIPTICLIDTDGDPELADIPIPGNDDSMRAIDIVIRELCAAVAEGRSSRAESAATSGERGDDDLRGDAAAETAPAGRRRSSRSQFRARGRAEEAETGAATRSEAAPAVENA